MFSSICRRCKSWKKGRGKRSKASIRPRKKTHLKTLKQEDPPAPVYPSQWISHVSIPEGRTSVSHETELRLCQISSQDVPSVSPLAVTCSIIVKNDCSWMMHINNHFVDPQNISFFVEVPPILDAVSTTSLLQTLCNLNTCAGNLDPKFIKLANSKKNGLFLLSKKEVVAYLDSGFCVSVDGQQYASTVCCSHCHLLTKGTRCVDCDVYRSTLTTMCYRFEKRSTSIQRKETNYRYDIVSYSVLYFAYLFFV